MGGKRPATKTTQRDQANVAIAHPLPQAEASIPRFLGEDVSVEQDDDAIFYDRANISQTRRLTNDFQDVPGYRVFERLRVDIELDNATEFDVFIFPRPLERIAANHWPDLLSRIKRCLCNPTT
jgi:hypothetical protein